MSQYEKILKIMLGDPRKEYWLPTDFMDNDLGALFVGYEASARLSELRKDFPVMFHGKRNGKYVATALNWELIRNGNYIKFLSPELRQVINPCLF